ncbi:defense against restriction DarA-related protein [Photobacterium toruni]|uniref:Defence against restriction A N-terminal domain-containing protein n=1 Tax=Photobacterium toruni TaxID=1935446 RepID=A0A1T4UK49_9GAMM|nr:hypothetical protein [Photobacterium toruni]SKA52948.1 hypothetical protein CZ814_03374 [Photobacterium toruni]
MKYLSFDFDQFNEKGLKKVIDEFQNQNLSVTSVEADNKPKRQSGVQTKKATLHFSDGQKLVLQATAQGSIFQVRLNTRVIPVKYVDDLKKAITEIATKVKSNSKQFQNTLQKRAVRSSNRTDANSKAKTSLKAQIALANADKEDLLSTVIKSRQEKVTLNDLLSEKQNSKEKVTLQLNQASNETLELLAEIEKLKDAD